MSETRTAEFKFAIGQRVRRAGRNGVWEITGVEVKAKAEGIIRRYTIRQQETPDLAFVCKWVPEEELTAA